MSLCKKLSMDGPKRDFFPQTLVDPGNLFTVRKMVQKETFLGLPKV